MKFFTPCFFSTLLFCTLQLFLGTTPSFANAANPILIHSAPVVVDGWIYFQRAHDDGPGEHINNGLYKISTDGSNLTFLNHYTKSPPCVSQDGFIYFQDLNDQLIKMDINGNNAIPLTAWAATTPCVSSSGDLYFQSQDLQLYEFEQPFSGNAWPVFLYSSCCSAPTLFENETQQKVFFRDNNNALIAYDCINKNTTLVLNNIESTPCIASDSTGSDHIFFQTTKNELKRAEIDGQNILSLNEHTVSTPCVGKDWWQMISYVYFQTPNNELKRVDIEGKHATFLHHKTISTPCAVNDWNIFGSLSIYFEGDDMRLLKCDENGDDLTDFESTDLIPNNCNNSSIPWNWD